MARTPEEPPIQGHQSGNSVDRVDDHVKSGDQSDIDREDGAIADDSKTIEPLVRQNVQRGLRGIAGDAELAANVELRKDCRRQRSEIRDADNARGGAL